MSRSDTPHKFYERLAALEIEVGNLKKDFEMFCNNHFITFQKEIRENISSLSRKINSRPTWLFALVLTILSSLCVGLMTFLATK